MKKRYIIGHRYGPKLDPRLTQEVDTFLAQGKERDLKKRTTVGRMVVEMSPQEISELAEKNPELVVEEDQELTMFPMPGIPNRVPTEGNFSLSVVVKDGTTGQPVPEATVYGIGEAGVAYRAVTDNNGQATLQTHESSLVQVIASPLNTYWSRVLSDVAVEGAPELQIDLKALMVTGAYDWGHRLMGFRKVNPYWTGNDIKVGVLDSGISVAQGDLNPAGGYNTLDGQDSTAWNVDEQGHGTHTGGIVAAMNNDIGVVGGAPNAQLYAIKVFPGGFISDLVEGVEWCIHNGMDVISMSLGSPQPSQILAGALRDAYDRGITCVAASGNDASHVAFPAAFPNVIAVGALGRVGTFPEDSAHTLKKSNITDWGKGLFAASFTNFGPEIDVCAPGVAILSTVPSGYASWDGTSMACPMVSALVALILEAYPEIRTADSAQVENVRSILFNASVDLGMPPHIQGYGLPLATRALAAAYPYAWYGQPPQSF